MTYRIDIELADVVGPALETLTDAIEDALLRHRETVDLDQLLAGRRAVAIVWEVRHVRDQRPGLSDGQAWEVLRASQRRWERRTDPMRETLWQVAENLFPDRTAPARR